MLNSHHTSNQVLASLARGDLDDPLPDLKGIELPRGKILYQSGDAIDTIYFPQHGLISAVVDLATGEGIEAGLIGRDGCVWPSAAFGQQISLCRAIVQVAGRGSTLPVDKFRALAEKNAKFRTVLVRYADLLLAQAQQSAACNAAHPVEARLARWLMRCRDQLHDDNIPLTQEYLAEMLGVRRTTVTLVAKSLQQAGLIHYRRGNIHIHDVDGLRESACECYVTLKQQEQRLLGDYPRMAAD